LGLEGLQFLKPHAHDLIDREGIGYWPEGGHNNKAEDNVPAPQKSGAKPDEMDHENTGAKPVCIMELPPAVSHVFK
jgi:hypothetical protein